MFGARRAPEVQKVDVRDGHVRLWKGSADVHLYRNTKEYTYWEQFTEGLVGLAVALVHLDRPVVVVVVVLLVGDVLDVAGATAAAEGGGLVRVDAGPDLDAGSVARVGHAVVEDVDVLDNVVLVHVLAKGPDRDAVAAVAREALDDDVGAIGLERDAVVPVVDDRVLDHDAVGAVRVPAVRILGRGARGAVHRDGDVTDQDIGCV